MAKMLIANCPMKVVFLPLEYSPLPRKLPYTANSYLQLRANS